MTTNNATRGEEIASAALRQALADLDLRTGQLLACRERCEALESAVKSVLCHHRVVALRKLGSDTLNPRIELLEKLTEGGAL